MKNQKWLENKKLKKGKEKKKKNKQYKDFLNNLTTKIIDKTLWNE